MAGKCLEELDSYLTEGVLTERYVLDNIQVDSTALLLVIESYLRTCSPLLYLQPLLHCLRRCNVSLRWIMLHRTTKHKKYAEVWGRGVVDWFVDFGSISFLWMFLQTCRPSFAMPCPCVVSCCTVMCCAVMWCAVLCCDVLWCAVMCCAVMSVFLCLAHCEQDSSSTNCAAIAEYLAGGARVVLFYLQRGSLCFVAYIFWSVGVQAEESV